VTALVSLRPSARKLARSSHVIGIDPAATDVAFAELRDKATVYGRLVSQFLRISDSW
jgi:hypothetical protein